MTVNITDTRLSRAEEAALQADMRALASLIRELAARAGPAAATPVDEWIKRATPDQMLDRWIAIRGEKAEAHLLTRIYRRRAARRV